MEILKIFDNYLVELGGKRKRLESITNCELGITRRRRKTTERERKYGVDKSR